MIRPSVVLVGPPGSGKTTVGTLVAQRLGASFRDTDDDVAARVGKSISEIFVDQGEAAFRALERGVVRQALVDYDGVLALGGGAILDDSTRALLKGHRVVFLDVDVADAAARVGLTSGRPLLFGNLRGQLRRLMDERRDHYLEVAETVVDTNGRSAEDVAEEVVRLATAA